jgi:hypothetical protein
MSSEEKYGHSNNAIVKSTYEAEKKTEIAVLMSESMKNTVFGVVILHRLADTYKHFGGSCFLHLQGRRTNPEAEGRKFLQNSGKYLPDYRVQHP